MYAVLQAILRWGHLWKGHQVIFHVDNTGVVSALLVGTIQNTQVMNILKWTIMLAVQLGFSYSSWLTSAHNLLAETASHFKYNQLLSIAPSLKRKPGPQHPQLCGIKHSLMHFPESHFFCGMALPPQPK